MVRGDRAFCIQLRNKPRKKVATTRTIDIGGTVHIIRILLEQAVPVLLHTEIKNLHKRRRGKRGAHDACISQRIRLDQRINYIEPETISL